MLFSPRLWFNLPPYLAFRGSLRKEMLSSWSGRLRVRALGFMLVTLLTFTILSIIADVMVADSGAGSDSRPHLVVAGVG
jgi:hypothetical protein